MHRPSYVSSRDALASLVWAEVKASGRTQADVCKAAGVSEKHLSQFFRGHAGMRLDLVDAVLAELDRGLVLATRVLTFTEETNDGR